MANGGVGGYPRPYAPNAGESFSAYVDCLRNAPGMNMPPGGNSFSVTNGPSGTHSEDSNTKIITFLCTTQGAAGDALDQIATVHCPGHVAS